MEAVGRRRRYVLDGGPRDAVRRAVGVLCALVGALALQGCFRMPYYPKTEAGAQCEHQCHLKMASCQGSSYTCDRFIAGCLNSCRDIENVVGKK
jgi:hypothetical protein